MKYELNHIYNEDCLPAMKEFPDKFFELAIVDPPYGIGSSDYKRGGTHYGKSVADCKIYLKKKWDMQIPNDKYFIELMRVSKNQIIWGGNYFGDYLGATSCWVVWDKDNGTNEYADCELAWTNFQTAVRKVMWRWHGMLQQDMKHKEERIHPTQKPVALYKWLLHNYAKKDDKILDTHTGSASSIIACEWMGFEYVGFEIDKEYYEASLKRLEKEREKMKQIRLDF